MAYNSQPIQTDINGNPIPQGYEPSLDTYRPQTLTAIGNNRYGMDVYNQGSATFVVAEDISITVAAGTTVRIDPPSASFFTKSGFNYLTIGVQESTNTAHDFELQRQPLGLNRTSFYLASPFAKFVNQYGGWEQIKLVTPRERIYIKNLSSTSKTYLCSVYLSVD